jgi:hypothetical protein
MLCIIILLLLSVYLWCCISDYTISNGRMISEQWIWKDVEGYNHGVIWGIILTYFPGETEETRINFSEDSQSPGWDSNWESPRYKSESLLLLLSPPLSILSLPILTKSV